MVYRIFKQSKGSAGSRTIANMATANGVKITRYIVRKLMKRLNLVSKQYKKPRKYESKNNSIVDNRLARQFAPKAPNIAWCGDITEIKIKGKPLYLAAVMDLYSRKIVGFKISKNMDDSIVIGALQNAHKSRMEPSKVIFHSDQGTQYRSVAFVKQLFRFKMIQSHSRKGNCLDNSPMERFFRSLKTEWIRNNRIKDLEELESEIVTYIHKYYNEVRPHTFNNSLSPNHFEEKNEKDYKKDIKKT